MFNSLSNNWHDVYHNNLLNVFLSKGELTNHTFVIEDPLDNLVRSGARNFRKEFSDVMFNWTMDGGDKITEEMIELNPNAAKYATTYEGEDFEDTICTAYGPRILHQWDYVVRELKRHPDSRRACIMLLNPIDSFIADAMAVEETTCEYLCTMGFTFRIQADGKLGMIATMRSNNYTTTVCQDVYVFTRIQQVMAEELKLPVGRYHHSTVSAHILKTETDLAVKILSEYMRKLPHSLGQARENRVNAFNNTRANY